MKKNIVAWQKIYRLNIFLCSRNPDGTIQYISPSVTNVLGYTQAEFLEHYSDYLTDNPINKTAKCYSGDFFNGHLPSGHEMEIYHKKRRYPHP